MLSEQRYEETKRKIAAYAPQHAENEYRSGADLEQDAPFSGEYADGLTLQKVLDRVGQPCFVSELTSEEEQDFMQVFEDEYFEAWARIYEEVEPQDDSPSLDMPSYAS